MITAARPAGQTSSQGLDVAERLPAGVSLDRLSQVASPKVARHIYGFACWLALDVEPTPQQKAEALAVIARGRVERQKRLPLEPRA